MFLPRLRSLLLTGGRLPGFPLRASNEGSPRLRVARGPRREATFVDAGERVSRACLPGDQQAAAHPLSHSSKHANEWNRADVQHIANAVRIGPWTGSL